MADHAGIHVTRLRLAQYRSYAALDLAIDAADRRPVLLLGPNGAGKTNLLEALSFLAPGRGLRGARLEEVTRVGAPTPWAVHAELLIDGEAVRVGTGLVAGPPAAAGGDEEAAGPRRTVRVHGRPEGGPQSLARYLSLLWLTPAMDSLFVEAAAARRRFLDRIVLTLHPEHGRHVTAFEQAMRERNRLLAARGCGADPAWLGALEARMAEQAVAIAAARRDTVGHLGAAAATGSDGFPGATITLAGWIEEQLGSASALETEDTYRARLAAERRRDAAAGRTGTGPHRSDLVVHHRDKAMPAALCSTGEQKALLVGLVLAHARLVAALGPRPPMLLLDEIAAHLDPHRLGALVALLAQLDSQVWMSGTDAGAFRAHAGRLKAFAVESGRIAPYRL